ncbi:MAG: hypothetical protein AAGF97_06400 [Planctomycetota bacterium]
MGLFWDLLQQSQIEQRRNETASLEQRVARLEAELQALRARQTRLLTILEEQVQQDLDGNGRIGG